MVGAREKKKQGIDELYIYANKHYFILFLNLQFSFVK